MKLLCVKTQTDLETRLYHLNEKDEIQSNTVDLQTPDKTKQITACIFF